MKAVLQVAGCLDDDKHLHPRNPVPGSATVGVSRHVGGVLHPHQVLLRSKQPVRTNLMDLHDYHGHVRGTIDAQEVLQGV
jgi:hypothetical protein